MDPSSLETRICALPSPTLTVCSALLSPDEVLPSMVIEPSSVEATTVAF